MGTLEKAFHIIQEVVAHQETGLHFSEVLARTDYPRSTVHKILKSLVNIGCLRHEEETGRYSGGLLLTSPWGLRFWPVSISVSMSARISSNSTAKPVTPATWAIRDEWSGVYIDRIESSDSYKALL